MVNSQTTEAVIAARLSDSGSTLAVAESCSGGLIAHRLTNVPGASAFFVGGVVAYSNAVKTLLLRVPERVLAMHGAVSEAVAITMAEGVRTVLDADYAVAVTGIAGPSGGSAEKPVGLVYVAAADGQKTRVMRHLFTGTRTEIKEQTADAALRLLREIL